MSGQCVVFKRTTDNWYGNYKVVDDCRVSDLVEVTFCGNISLNEQSPIYRVCVWGNDDCGIEFDTENEATAWNVFLQVIGNDDVTMKLLKQLNFMVA